MIHSPINRKNSLAAGTQHPRDTSPQGHSISRARVCGQRDPQHRLRPARHCMPRPGHLQLRAAVLQEHAGQVAQTRAFREGEAQHALHHGQLRDLGLRRCRGQVHEGGDGGEDDLLPAAGEAGRDQWDPSALQDEVPALTIHAEVA